jgi:hypothetical protein
MDTPAARTGNSMLQRWIVVGLGCDNGGLLEVVGGRDGGTLMDQVESVDVYIQEVEEEVEEEVVRARDTGGKVKLNGGSTLIRDGQIGRGNMLDFVEGESLVST